MANYAILFQFYSQVQNDDAMILFFISFFVMLIIILNQDNPIDIAI